MNKLLLVLFLAAAGLGGAWWWTHGLAREGGGAASVRFRTGKVDRGEVVEGVQATGAVQPLLLVQVGTQVSGTIERLFKDYNDHVKEGETIALLDSRRLVAQVAQDEASLGRARADLVRNYALLRQAERNLDRQRKLAANDYASALDLDAAIANAESLRAQVDVAAAVVSQAISQRDGDLVNLRYATVNSPVDGVVVSRNVDVGQTVAASLSAPTLFVIANDLTKVQVQASVPEADIGKIHDGQRARFGVDAHPQERFDGRVSQVRLASTTVQNVVTYTVLVDAQNPKGLLLPGMTANVTFEIARSAKDSLRLPASALRFQPPPDLVQEKEAPASAPASEKPPRERPLRKGPPPARVWVKTEDGRVRPVALKLGASDGVLVAVEPRDPAALSEGTEVVTGILRDEPEAVNNPFAPPRMGGPRR